MEIVPNSNNSSTDRTNKNLTRRDFVKKAGASAVVFAIEPMLSGEEAETIKMNEATAEEIRKCKKIIENEQYGEILKNPCLVSALYYSKHAIEKMAPPHKNDPEQIIWSIYPLVTKKFRENYINTLEKITLDNNSEQKNLTTQSLPLDTITFDKNLKRNHLDAIDLFTEEGSPIYSMSGGIVVLAENGWKRGDAESTSSEHGGNTVIIFNPNDNSFYRYAHMQETGVSTEAVLISGEKIGKVGHTGLNASKPGHGGHLHLEINKYDKKDGEMMALDVFALKRKIEALEKTQ
ncbi:MAG: M23 family metallopeptidase [Candidatus Pacebacteria bacterium]|nr:M23 family metallopeptidase [Candidatus Paceibacterota bacterium]